MVSTVNADNGVSSGSAGLKSSADSSGVLQLQTNGTAAVTVDTSQNVGIGTSSPAFKLEIVGGTNNGVHLKDAASATVYGGLFTQSANLALVTRSNHALTFGTNDTERMRVNAGAPILCLSGGSTTATGTGIAFPATQSASSDVNTLDDYEEGTWTPVWNATSGSMSYSLQVGKYVKVGKLVTATCHIITSANNALSGGLYMSGLPFTSDGTTNNYVVGCLHVENVNLAASAWIWTYVAPGSAIAYFRYWNNNAAAGVLGGSNLNAGSDIMATFTYSASA